MTSVVDIFCPTPALAPKSIRVSLKSPLWWKVEGPKNNVVVIKSSVTNDKSNSLIVVSSNEPDIMEEEDLKQNQLLKHDLQ